MKKRKSAAPTDSPPLDRLELLRRISGETVEGKAPPVASNQLQEVRYVPTIFTSFNRAIVVGGAPVRATWLIHGPPAGGKTALAAGILRSFQENGHVAGYIDAEHASDKTWFQQMGLDLDSLLFDQPDSFESGIATIDKWISNFAKMKREGEIPESTCFALAVDTVHKLTPEKELKLALEKDKEMQKGWGRYRSNLISVWMDRMTPLVGKNDIALLLLAHEHTLPSEGTSWYDDEYRVKGGQTLVFEAMVRARVKEKRLWQEQKGKKRVVGKEHRVLIEKNKVGYPFETATFFTSNGKGTAPKGFDLAQEIFTEGVARGIITQSGSWYTLPGSGECIQGEIKTVEILRENMELYTTLYNELTNDLERKKGEPDQLEG